MIYYSHVNEDSTPERSALSRRPYGKLICIAGSGERVIALLDSPYLKQVEIVDDNAHALYLTELKLVALKYLEVNEYLTFIGMKEEVQCHKLLEMFKSVAPYLSVPCRSFWGKNFNKIIDGPLLKTGHFEKFLDRTALLMRIVLGPAPVNLLRVPFDSWSGFDRLRWKLVLKCFGFKWCYRILGLKDPAFVDQEADAELIPKAIQHLAQSGGLDRSFFMHLIFNGNLAQMQDDLKPESLKSAVLKRVKQNLQRKTLNIQFFCNDILSHCVAAEETSDYSEYRFYSLSDLGSFVSQDYLEALLVSIFRRNPVNSSVMLRSFLKHRHFDFASNEIQVVDCSHLDSTLMYKVLLFEAVNVNEYANQY